LATQSRAQRTKHLKHQCAKQCANKYETTQNKT